VAVHVTASCMACEDGQVQVRELNKLARSLCRHMQARVHGHCMPLSVEAHHMWLGWPIVATCMLHSSVCASPLLNGESAIRVDACVPWQDKAHLIAQRAACVGVGGGEVVGCHGPCGPMTRRDLHRAGRRPLTTVHQGSELRRLVSSSHRGDGNQNENRRRHPELRMDMHSTIQCDSSQRLHASTALASGYVYLP
jgi:hypothetical protein